MLPWHNLPGSDIKSTYDESSLRKVHSNQLTSSGWCSGPLTCHWPGYCLNTEAVSPSGRKEYVTVKRDRNSFRIRLTFKPRPTSPLQCPEMQHQSTGMAMLQAALPDV